MVRDEFSRLRAHLFEAVEASGWRPRQEKGWKGVIRTITYNSQGEIEAALRRAANGGNMPGPGITDAHVEAAYNAVYGAEPEEAAQPTAEAAAAPEEAAVEAEEAAPVKVSTRAATKK